MLHVDIPTRDEIVSLVEVRGDACVSIYQPTTPVTVNVEGDRIALKNLVREAVAQLGDHDKREVKALEERLLDLIDDDAFWAFQANSLAVFATPEMVRTYRLANHLEQSLEVGDRFYVKPLLRAATVPHEAFVLALSANGARVVEVSVEMPAFEVKLQGMPADAASAVGKAAISRTPPSGRLQGDEGVKVRLTQYARKVDAVLRSLLAGRETPLILAAAEPLLSIYREVQSYPHLAATVLEGNPDALSDAELAQAARGVVDAVFAEQLAVVRDLWEERTGQGRTTTGIDAAALAATRGAVHLLLVDIDAVVPGTVSDAGVVSLAEAQGPRIYGVVDEVAARALLTGARVLGLRAADIPGGGPVAAILRYEI
jgi:hypothetical protein